MNSLFLRLRAVFFIALASLSFGAVAADFPGPKEASAIIKNFRFNTGEVMPELRINYVTVGEPT